MGLFDIFRGRSARDLQSTRDLRPNSAPLAVESLETREMLDANASLAAGLLTVVGGAGTDRVGVYRDTGTDQIVILDGGHEVGRFAAGAVTNILINTGAGNDAVRVAPSVFQAATLDGGAGNDLLIAGSGPTTLLGGDGNDRLIAGAAADMLFGGAGNDKLVASGNDVLDGGAGHDKLFAATTNDTITADAADRVFRGAQATAAAATEVLTAVEVDQLLQRAAAASASNDAIIAIVDRGGRVLGTRVESGVALNIQGTASGLTFAVDGALALARTAAFFANNQAPLTSRTIQFISQSTITQREVESIPSLIDPNSTLRGPGFVAPIGVGGHFPPGVQFTPQVDLFGIEHTNRDSIRHPGADHIKGTVDDQTLPNRFNVPDAFIPTTLPADQRLAAPESYGFVSGIQPNAQSRGIGTLPGGIPIYKNNQLVGGIGVFFPGTTGFASEENSALDVRFDPTRRDRSLEAEFIAFAAVGGAPGAGAPIGTLGGVAPVPGIGLPFGRIDLVGITLDVFGPRGVQGPEALIRFGQSLGQGTANDGNNVVVNGNTGQRLEDGRPVPDGWLVTPHDGVGLTAHDVMRIVAQGVEQALQTRAAIRLPLGSRTAMVFAVTDLNGEVLGLFRMPDATVFSVDVAVAKGRNVAYYADPSVLQPVDQIAGVPSGVAFTNRTFRYAAEPRFPEAIDGAPPGPFSTLNDGGANVFTGLNTGAPLPASAYQSVLGYDAFNPGTNFRDPDNVLNQNGVVFFPGSAPLYKVINGQPVLVGGLGVSGDGVDQDDVVTAAAARGYQPPPGILRADQVAARGVRLPYMKFNRNPEA